MLCTHDCVAHLLTGLVKLIPAPQGPVSECSSVKHKGNMRKATNAENDSDDEDGLFASMLGNWGDKDDANVMNREFKQGDAHEGMEGLGSFSAAGDYIASNTKQNHILFENFIQVIHM